MLGVELLEERDAAGVAFGGLLDKSFENASNRHFCAVAVADVDVVDNPLVA